MPNVIDFLEKYDKGPVEVRCKCGQVQGTVRNLTNQSAHDFILIRSAWTLCGEFTMTYIDGNSIKPGTVPYCAVCGSWVTSWK